MNSHVLKVAAFYPTALLEMNHFRQNKSIEVVQYTIIQPGRQLAEYMRDERSQEDKTSPVYKLFEFTPHTQQNTPHPRISGHFKKTQYSGGDTVILNCILVNDHFSDSESDNDSAPAKKNGKDLTNRFRGLKIPTRSRVFGGPLRDAAKNQHNKIPFGMLSSAPKSGGRFF